MAERAAHRPHIAFARARFRLGVLIAVSLALLVLVASPVRAAPFAATVMDARTGQILVSTNDTTRLHPASLTKMMTLYVVFEAIRNGEISLDTRVQVSRRAAREPPSRLGLREGQRIQVRHLIRAAALRSGNDAATALAEAVSGSVEAFAARMNRTAAAIGMTQTQFRNAHGLTQAGHMSTARDMTILGRQLFFDFPEYWSLWSRRSEDAGIATVTNTNGRFLDGYSGADGIKTGFTSAAGFNLTASAERNGVRIIVTVFGGRSLAHRHEQVVQLMNRGFSMAPARATVRRPPPPNYGRQPPRAAQTQVAEAPAASGSRAAGRVIRLQTAPARSIFPQRRPGSQDTPAPSDALLAAVQQGIETALAPPPAPPAPPVAADAVAAAVAQAIEPVAPGRSPRPPARPEGAPAPVAVAAAPPVPDLDAEVMAARAAGFSVIDPETFAALTEEPAAAPPAAAMVAPPPPRPAADGAVPAPVEALAAAAPPLVEMLADPEAQPAPEIAPEVALAPDTSGQTPGATLAPAVGAGPLEMAAVEVTEGLVVIPGLPPIPLQGAVEPALPPLAPREEPALIVTAAGQILWHDADVLASLDEIAPPVGPRALVLTEAAAEAPAPAAPPAPEVVVRVATSGGQLWAVDLGTFGSRFDAERTLLRVALAESAVLGGGVRRVEERGRGHRALVLSLSEDQASLACQRLAMMAQACEIVAP